MLVELFAEESQHRGEVTGCGLAVREDGSEAVYAGWVAPCLVAENLRQRGCQTVGSGGFGHLVFDPAGELGEIAA